MYFAGGQQPVPPGVAPQHYQRQQPYQQTTGGQQPIPPGVAPQHYQQQQPMGQQVPQPQQQHIPGQQQQQQQQMHMQQPQMQHVPVQQQMPQQPPHQQAHHHGHPDQPPQVLNVANIAEEKDHIAEHLEVPLDTSKMTVQELQFHYFKMHDADNNNKLDGCELIKAMLHGHAERGVEDKLFKDDELVSLIDPILSLEDANVDGFIDYPEFVAAATTPHARR